MKGSLCFCVHPCWRGNEVCSKEGKAEITVQLIAFDLAANQLLLNKRLRYEEQGQGNRRDLREKRNIREMNGF